MSAAAPPEFGVARGGLGNDSGARWGCCVLLTHSGVLLVDGNHHHDSDSAAAVETAAAAPLPQLDSRNLCRLVASIVQLARGASAAVSVDNSRAGACFSAEGAEASALVLEGRSISILDHRAMGVCAAGWLVVETTDPPSTNNADGVPAVLPFLKQALLTFAAAHSCDTIASAVAAADAKLNEQCEKYSAQSVMDSALSGNDDSSRTVASFQAFRDTWLVPALCHRRAIAQSAATLHAPRPPEESLGSHRGRRPVPSQVKVIHVTACVNKVVVAVPPGSVGGDSAAIHNTKAVAGSGVAAARTL